MKLTESLEPSEINRLAKSLSTLGWGGLVLQVLMAAIPLVMMIYTLLFAGASREDAERLPFVQLFSMIDLALLLFVIVWFFRYTRIGKRLRRTPDRVTLAGTRRTVWFGLAATTAAILFSMLVLLFEVGNMLFFFLSLPQGTFAAFQAPLEGAASWVSAVDMISLMSLVLTLGGEVFALIFGLLILSRVVKTSVIAERGT